VASAASASKSAASSCGSTVDTAYTISGLVAPKGDPEGTIEGVLVGAWMMQPMALLVANALILLRDPGWTLEPARRRLLGSAAEIEIDDVQGHITSCERRAAALPSTA
jgi:hypothetical protein